jgi:hypothetical protein
MTELRPDEIPIFDIYFPSLACMTVHPGSGRSNGFAEARAYTLEEVADMALHMIAIRRRMIGREP